MTEFRLGILFGAPILGSLAGRSGPGAARRTAALALTVAPTVVFTAAMVIAESAPEGFWLWWRAGMGMVGMVNFIWAALLTGGYAIARARRR